MYRDANDVTKYVACFAMFAVLQVTTASLHAQCVTCSPNTYAASTGAPESACWRISPLGDTTQTLLNGTTLKLSSSVGGGVDISSTSVAPFRWADGQAFEARMRVITGGSGFLPGYRAASYVIAVDGLGRGIALWLEPSRVVLSTASNSNPGTGTAMYPMDASSAFHTFRVVTDIAGARLLVDGIARLEVPYVSTDGTANTFSWGNDARFSWSSVSKWQRVSLELPSSSQGCDNCAERTYSATQGVPEGVCWNYISGASSTATLIGNELQLVSTAGTLDYARATPAFSWSDGQTMEARVRVTSGGSGFFPGYRAAAFFSAFDRERRSILVFIEPTRVALSTDQNANAGSGTALLSIDAASQFRTYTVVTDLIGARLLIDGVERLTVPYTTAHPSIANYVNWGHDARFGWTSASQWTSFRLAAVPSPSDVTTCPQASAMFSIASAGASDGCTLWQIDSAGDGAWLDLANGMTSGVGVVSGATTRTLIVSHPAAGLTARVRAVLTRPCGVATSNAASLVVTSCDCLDYNNDGLFPDDEDFISFLAILAGGACTSASCNDIDFNNDGLFPDDSDLIAFLAALGGGAC